MNFQKLKYSNKLSQGTFHQPANMILSRRAYPPIFAERIVGTQPKQKTYHHPYPKKYNHKEWM